MVIEEEPEVQKGLRSRFRKKKEKKQRSKSPDDQRKEGRYLKAAAKWEGRSLSLFTYSIFALIPLINMETSGSP